MNRLQKTCVLFFLVFMNSLFAPVFAETARLECRIPYESSKSELSQLLNELEATYARYRWLEEKIRWLYYERLWQARYEANDPFSKSIRKEARKREDELHADLEMMQAQSADLSNLFYEQTEKIKSFHAVLHEACPEKHYETCITEAHRSLYRIMESVDNHFNQVFEAEREYRTSIAETAAGPKGLYPEDALDLSDEHEDYFWRFENARHKNRFLENQEMMSYFHEAYQFLEWSGKLDHCCYRCGKTEEEIESLITVGV